MLPRRGLGSNGLDGRSASAFEGRNASHGAAPALREAASEDVNFDGLSKWYSFSDANYVEEHAD